MDIKLQVLSILLFLFFSSPVIGDEDPEKNATKLNDPQMFSKGAIYFSEDFEDCVNVSGDTVLPTGWTKYPEDKKAPMDTAWIISADNATQYTPIPPSSVYASINDDVMGSGANPLHDSAVLISPVFDLSSAVVPKLSFDYFPENTAYNPDPTSQPDAHVLITTDGGNSFDLLFEALGYAPDQWYSQEIDLYAYAGESNVRIVFYYSDFTDVYGGAYAIDNIQVYEPDPVVDLEVTGLTSGFFNYTNSQPLSITVNNPGTKEIDAAGWSVTLTNGVGYNETVVPDKAMALNETYEVIMPPMNTSQGTTYSLTATVNVIDDVEPSNNQMISEVGFISNHYRAVKESGKDFYAFYPLGSSTNMVLGSAPLAVSAEDKTNDGYIYRIHNNNMLTEVDPENGSTTDLGTLGLPINHQAYGITTDLDNDRVFVVSFNTSTNNNYVFEVNIETLQCTEVYRNEDGFYFQAVEYINGMLYIVEGVNKDLYKYDLTAGTLSLVGGTNASTGVNDMDYDEYSGNLMGVDNNKFGYFNLETGAFEQISTHTLSSLSTLTTYIPTYYATFTVISDGGSPVENATVTVDGADLTTNSSGEAVVRLLDGTYSYIVTKGGYDNSEGQITIDGADINESVTLNAFHTIAYNANSVEVTGSVPTDANDYIVNDEVTVPGQGTLAYAGYTFAGWNPAADGSGATYQENGTFIMPAADVTLYAVWTAIDYTITYDANGGTGDAPIDGVNHNVGDQVAVLGQGALTYAGYTFAGWNTATDGSGTEYLEGATLNMPAADVTLYAVWTAIDYTITYDANGGTGDAPIDGVNHNVGDQVAVLGQGALTYAGYTFAGWNTATDGSGTEYLEGATLNMPAADVTLYAVWIAIDYFITYNANSVEVTGNAPVDASPHNVGDEVTVPGQGTLAYAGYTFAGWNTAADGSGTEYLEGATLNMPAADVTLYAVWTAIDYTITYDANGGTDDAPIDATNYNVGNVVTVLGQGTLAYAGYTFAGWNTAADGSGATYQENGTFIMPAAEVTLYAVWIAIDYFITYNANSVEVTGNAPVDASPHNVGDEVTVPGQGTLVYAGYTFAGWNTAADGSGTEYLEGATLNMPAADVTLYAVWTAIDYTITYDANGGTDDAPIDATNYNVGNVVTVLGQGTLAYAGYTFAGWNTSADGNGTTYQEGATFTMATEDVTLYAIWTAIDYTITYDANGGTGDVPVDASPHNVGNDVLVQGQGTLAYTNYTFAGWNTSADGSGTTYLEGATYIMPANNVTLYAVWEEITYTITYDANGGTGDVPVDAVNYNVGNEVTVLGQGTLTYAGYTFAEWNTAADGTGTAYLEGATFTMATEDVTLYAVWTAIDYTITYDANGGTGDVPVDGTNYNVGDEVTILGQGTLAYAGYTFAGWNTAADGSGTTYQEDATFTMATEDVTLYAVWTAIDYTITYDANGGTGDVPVDGTNYNVGDEVTILGQGTLAYAGHTFVGWNTASDGSGTTYQEDAIFIMATEDVTLYAKWEAIDYTITYDANGGSGDVPVDANTYNIGNEVTVLGQGTLAYSGYTFAGWNTAADGSGTTYQEGSTFIMATEDVTLYAKWEGIPTYTVSFTVVDENNNTLENAAIDIDGSQLATDASGNAAIELINGAYDYSVSLAGYDVYENTVTVANDNQAVNVTLIETRYTVSFTVTNENGTAVEGAEITIDETQLITDADGLASVDLVNGTYDVSIIKDGFQPYDESVTVDGEDLTIDVTMVGMESVPFGYSLYPNPVQTELQVEVDAVSVIEIYNVSGKRMHESHVTDQITIDVSAFPRGVYVIRLVSGKYTITEQLIVE